MDDRLLVVVDSKCTKSPVIQTQRDVVSLFQSVLTSMPPLAPPSHPKKNPSKSFPVLGGCDHAGPLLQLWLSVTRLPAAIKYVCFPFEQFIELPDISGPARPQMGPVEAEMERELCGPSGEGRNFHRT